MLFPYNVTSGSLYLETKQLRIISQNSSKTDPEKIEEYIAADGYLELHEVLRETHPDSVIVVCGGQ